MAMRFTAKELSDIVGGTLSGDETAVCTGAVRDNREITDGSLFFAIRGERFDGNDFLEDALSRGASVVIGERSVQPERGASICVSDSVRAMGDLAREIRNRFEGPVTAVTGSVGKTSTKDMVACALSTRYRTHKTPENFNNDIGLPLTLFALPEACEALILEMGMNHRGELSYLTSIGQPDVAVITNIGLSHIENLGSQENILAAKLEILEGLRAGGCAVLNADDPFLWRVKDSLSVRCLWYGIENPDADVRGILSGDDLLAEGEVIRLTVPGAHNRLNALCAMAVARAVGISPGDAARGLERFRPEGNRQHLMELSGGVTLYNDCYNAAPQSVRAALSVLAGLPGERKIAILGDMFELGDFALNAHYETGKAVGELGVDLLLTVGEMSRNTARGANAAGMTETNVFSYETNDGAIAWLRGNLRPGDVILVKGSHGMHMEEIGRALTQGEDDKPKKS